MPVHRFQTPDGKIHRVEAPDRQSAETEFNRAVSGAAALSDARSRYTSQAPRGRALEGNMTPLLQGAMFNYADELTSRIPQLETAVGNVGRRIMGQPIPYTAQQSYDASKQAFREAEAKSRAQYPGAGLATEVAGAVMSPGSKAAGGFVVGAKTLPQMMARSAAIGGIYGGLSGSGSANEGDRVSGGVGGSVTGGLTGAFIPPAFLGLQKLIAPAINKVADLSRPAVTNLAERYAPSMTPRLAPRPQPIPRPELRVARALDRGVRRDAASGVPQRAGSIPFQSGGDNIAAIAEVLAQSPGPAQGIIRKTASDSLAATRGKLKQSIATGMGGRGDYFESLDNLFAARREAAKDGMASFGDQLVRLDENSVLAMRSDLSRTAIKDAAGNALASPDPQVREAGAALNRLHDQLLDKPSAITIRVRDAQDISRALLEGSKAAYSSGDGARGGALKTLGKAVRTNASTPEQGGYADYGAWLKQYGDDSDNIEALEMGRSVLSNKLDNAPEKLRRTLDDMGGPAKEYFRKGVGEALLEQVRRKGVGAMRAMMKDEDYAAKVRLAYPTDEGFNAFMKIADDAIQNEARSSQVLFNSRTDARGAARADLNDEGLDPIDMMETLTSPAGLVRGGTKAALKAIPRRDRSLIGNPETNAIAGRAVTSQDEMTRLLNLLELDRARSLRSAAPSAYIAAPASQTAANRR